MDIHQMQVKYDPTADRLLWQVRTRTGEIYAVWLTRRMVARLWPPFQTLVTRSAVAKAAPGATVMPEAQAMLAQAALERPLPAADFKTRFDATPTAQPLGAEPLLPTAIDLAPGASGSGLAIRLREPGGRNINLNLGDDLATALMRLLDKALAASEWGLELVAAAAPPQEPVPPSALN